MNHILKLLVNEMKLEYANSTSPDLRASGLICLIALPWLPILTTCFAFTHDALIKGLLSFASLIAVTFGFLCMVLLVAGPIKRVISNPMRCRLNLAEAQLKEVERHYEDFKATVAANGDIVFPWIRMTDARATLEETCRELQERGGEHEKLRADVFLLASYLLRQSAEAL